MPFDNTWLEWNENHRQHYMKEYWDKTPNDIKEGAFRGMKRVEKEYPDEVSRLQKEFKIGEVSFTNPDWQHGFHSGCLAAFRFALTAMDDSTHFDEEIGEEISLGGLDRAKEEFPELDT